ASAPAAKPTSPTSCCRRCATSSADTWKSRKGSEATVKIEVLDTADAVAAAAAAAIAEDARQAVASRGRFVLAVSGGDTPWAMLKELAKEDVPWVNVHVFQVDERIAPPGDPDRNLTHLKSSLLENAPLPPDNIHAMPVEMPDPTAAAKLYA